MTVALRRTWLALVAIIVMGTGISLGMPSTAAAVDDGDWLGIVNTYRAMSGLAPVSENSSWTQGEQAHSCYMLRNGITHYEQVGAPLYTAAGAEAGRNGNVAVSGTTAATPRSHIDLWMTGPFHAIGLLRYNLAQTAYGECKDANGASWKAGATIDVLRGLDYSRTRPSTPIVFPGDGSTVPLYRFVTESPDPLALCNWQGVAAGLPLIAMFPNKVTWSQTTLTGPNGPVETCSLHGGNTAGNSTAQAILNADNGVIVMPKTQLVDGRYSVTVDTDGGTASWSFTVDRNGALSAGPPPPLPTTQATSDAVRFVPNEPYRLVDTRFGQGATRLRGGTVTRIQVTDAGASAVSANFVAVNSTEYGYLTAYNCTPTVPTVSTLGYSPYGIVANQAIVPLDEGALCLFALRDVDVVIDVNGTYRANGAGFVPITPARLYDSRGGVGFGPGEERSLTVAGTDTVPAGAAAVALNVTAVDLDAYGYVQVYPCGSPTGSQISSINYAPGDVRPNTVVVPVDGAGRVCLRTLTSADLVVDVTGYFSDTTGLSFQPLAPVRMFDSRSTDPALNPITGGQRAGAGWVLHIPIAGERGIPGGAKAVSANITATDALAGTHLTAFPCGAQPPSSNLNLFPGPQVAANGAMVELSPGGELCIFTLQPVHVIVDVNGVWL